MLLVIFRFRGERYEMTFTAKERTTAEHFANRYRTTVIEPGVLVGKAKAVRRRAS